MRNEFTILIADRNRHVREFFCREFTAEGYRVVAARDSREVLAIIDGDTPPDLLILDLEIPHRGGLEVLERLRERGPHVPVVIHSFVTENFNHPAVQGTAAFVEKSGNNINHFRATIREVLRKHYPHRFTK